MTISYKSSPLFSGENLRYRDFDSRTGQNDIATFLRSPDGAKTLGMDNDGYIFQNGNRIKFTNIVTISDFTDTTLTVSTVKDTAVEILGAPVTSHYVPVVVGHVSTNAVQEHVFWDSKWFIYSTASQTTKVKFHKIPK